MSVRTGEYLKEKYIYIYKILYTFYRRVLYLFLFDTVHVQPGCGRRVQIGALPATCLPTALWAPPAVPRAWRVSRSVPTGFLECPATPSPGAGVAGGGLVHPSCFSSPIVTVTVTFNRWTFI